MLKELKSELRQHETIRRKFIFDTYQDRTATELFIAVMAWGLGLSNYGPSRAGGYSASPNARQGDRSHRGRRPPGRRCRWLRHLLHQPQRRPAIRRASEASGGSGDQDGSQTSL